MTAKRYLWILFAFFALAGCDDLEDTYSDYAGDGQIRYLTKCSDVKIVPGWEKLNMTWKNSTDPVVDSIRITWTLDKNTKKVMLPPTSTAYTIEGLKEEGSYEVTICGVDNAGNTSLVITNYVRPYTENHETILNFPRLVQKHFFVEDNLIIYFSAWTDMIESAYLAYTRKSDNTEQKLLLSSDFVTANKYYRLEDVKEDGVVLLYRNGNIEGEVVPLAGIELDKKHSFSVDFKTLFREKFGVENPTVEQLNSISELNINYSLNSLEDILYLPNLKRLNLAGNRYQYEPDLSNYYNTTSVLYDDINRSIFALEIAHEVYGLEVYRYNKHFLPDMAENAYFHHAGNPVEPTLNYLSTEDWNITEEPGEEEGIPSTIKNMFDMNFSTNWAPTTQATWREHIITLSRSEKKTVHGIRLVQPSFATNGFVNSKLSPTVVKIQVSENGYDWENATYLEENTLGTTSREATIIHFPEPKDILMIRFIFNDQAQTSTNMGVVVSEISLF